jgi:peptide/nickel transport system substrate-binding protein
MGIRIDRGRPLIVAAAATAAIALIASCSSSKTKGGNTGGNSPSASGASSSSTSSLGPAIINGDYTQKGGTVNVLVQSNFEHLDPVQNYVTNSGNVGRLIYRTLTVFDDRPGQTPKIEPDLATGLGTPNADKSVWTYHIRKGLKFQDGAPITAKDIKYNIERSFASDIYKDGATYMPDTLINSNNYAGPYKDPNKDLTSVQTPDPYTLVFHFQGPQPDADMMLSLFYTAPVPKAKDTKQDYDFKPVASGPYMIGSYTPNKQLVLVRNPNWDPASDPNRPALPDKFVITMGIAPATISARLIADAGDDQAALSIDNSSDIQAGDIPKLRGPDVKSRFVNGATPCVFYDILNEQKIKDADVRHAFAMALNRQAIITAMNGPLFGSIPQSFMSTSVRGYQPMNLGLKDTGDLAAAKALLQGKSYPKTITYAVSAGRPVQKAVAVQAQSDLAQLGVHVNITSIATDSYYKTLRTDPGPADMAMAGWCWDWPTMGSIVPPVLGADASGKTWSTNNFSKYYDSTMAKQITALAGSTQSPQQVDQQFAQIANQIVTTNWPMVPIQATLNPGLVGSKIRNAGISTIFGLPDLNIIGVAH